MAASGKRNFKGFSATNFERWLSCPDPDLPDGFIMGDGGFLIRKLPVTGI